MFVKSFSKCSTPALAPRAALVAIFALGLVACGNSDPSDVANGNAGSGNAGTGQGGSDAGSGTDDAGAQGGNPGSPDASLAPFLPWQDGNTWTYRVTEAGVTSTKVTTVGALEPVGGTGPNADLEANKVETTKGAGGMDLTVSWQLLVGERVLRYREQSFSASTGDLELDEHWDPHKIHFDGSAEHIVANATWLEEYQETKLPVGGAPETATARDRWTVIAVDEEVTVPAGTFSALVLTKAGGTSLKTYYYVRGVGKVKEEGTQTEELESFEVNE
jgi:hypothetical protein